MNISIHSSSRDLETAEYARMFQSLSETNSYSDAVKMLMSPSVGIPDTKCMDFIARKIFDNGHDIGGFFGQLQQMSGNGYTFGATHINKLMDYIIRNFNVDFHQFVLTRIVGKLTKSELDRLDSEILHKFSQRRLDHVGQHRIGLSRKLKKKTS